MPVTEPKLKPGWPAGKPRPDERKSHVRMNLKLSSECRDAIGRMVESGAAENLTDAIESCIRPCCYRATECWRAWYAGE